MQLKIPALLRIGAVILLAANPASALAYMGPGLGLGAIGSALGVMGAVLLALISIVWYPCKRLIRRMRGTQQAQLTKDNSSSPPKA